MAPRGSSVWRRPYTSIYNDNYRYGSSLYTGTLDSIQKKYEDSISKTHLRSDRGDLNLTTFAGSSLTSAPPSAIGSTSSPRHSIKTPPKSLSTPPYEPRIPLRTALSEDKDTETSSSRRIRSYADFDTFRSTLLSSDRWEPLPPVLPMIPSVLPNVQEEDEGADSETKRRRRRPESREGVEASAALDKCRDLQFQIDVISRTVSEAETRIRSEVMGMKSKMQTELTELSMLMEDSNQQNGELQRLLKRQATQLADMQANYEEVQRHLQETLETLKTSQSSCQSVKSEIDKIRGSFETSTSLRLSPRRF